MSDAAESLFVVVAEVPDVTWKWFIRLRLKLRDSLWW